MNSRIAATDARTYWTIDDIRSKIERSTVVVFSKGNQITPRCGFSKDAFQAIKQCGCPFEVVDVCADKSILAALRAYGERHSLPLVFANGALVSSSENLEQMLRTGTFQQKISEALDTH